MKMSCAGCANSVESMLKSIPGVISANVNFASASVLVDYNPDAVTPEQMQKTVQSIGYDLVIEDEKKNP